MKKVITKEYLILITIILIGLFPRLWRLKDDLQIHFDQGLHSLAIWNIWHEGKFGLLGHQTDTDGIFHGPLYYWFMIPSYVLGQGDPYYASVFQILFESVGMVFLYLLAREMFDKKVALLAVAISSFSYGQISFVRWLSNVTPTLPISIIFFYFLWKSISNNKFFPIAIFFASVVTQFDGALGFFLYPLLGLFILRSGFRKLSKFTLIGILVLGLIPHLPSLLFELRHDWVVTRAVLRLSADSQRGVGVNINTFSENLSAFIKEIFHILSYPIKWITLALLAVASLLHLLNLKHKSIKFIIISILLPFAVLSLFQRGAAGFFFVPLFPLVIIAVSYTITKFGKLGATLTVLLLFVLNVYQWKNFLIPTHALTPIGTFNLITNSDRKNIVDWIYSDTNGNPFGIWIYTIPYNLDDPWSYYFVWYGKQRYGFLPNKLGGFTSNDDLKFTNVYLIYEPDDNRPTRLNSWLEVAEENFGNSLNSFRSNDAIVDKRIWKAK